jgi:dihydrofolate reductase
MRGDAIGAARRLAAARIGHDGAVARLLYAAITSLDGYIADEQGNFDWAAPDAEVHAFVNDLERPIGTYLYGRRMYEVMQVWETFGDGADDSPATRDYADVWRAADKIVYSRSLADVSTSRTRLERSFEPSSVRALKTESASDLGVGGAGLAAEALAAGLVDEVSLFLTPVVVGGGTAALPAGIRLQLALLDEHRFDNGVVYVRYRVDG